MLDILQLHRTRGSHVSISVFPNVYNRVSVLSVSHVLTGQKLQTNFLFICYTVLTILCKKIETKISAFFPPFPLYTQFLKLSVLVCFHLFLKKHCT